MRSVLRWWHARTSAERLDLSTRWTLYLVSAGEPLYAALIAFSDPDAPPVGVAAFVLVAAAQMAVCVRLLRAGLSGSSGRGRPSRRLVAVATGLTVLGLVATAATFPAPEELAAGEVPAGLLGSILFAAAFLAALTPVLAPAGLVGSVLGGALVVVGWTSITGTSGEGPLLAGATYLLWIAVVTVTYAGSAWMIHLVWEIDRARAAEARLAVAEERLRFARDLHDVLGRNLSLIAVKSELAGRLARRGDGGAVTQMEEIRQVAHDSLREVRAVVGGYRNADLSAELTGAKSVLRAAGVGCRVLGDVTGLPEPAQDALGWVVREGTTNIIRHSDATECTIELDMIDQPSAGRTAVLRMVNDGVRPRSEGGAPGSGLLGLSERLAGVGGRLMAEGRGRRFVVEARLPLSGPAPERAP